MSCSNLIHGMKKKIHQKMGSPSIHGVRIFFKPQGCCSLGETWTKTDQYAAWTRPIFSHAGSTITVFSKKSLISGLSFSWKILWTSSAWLKNKRKLVGLSAMGVYNQTVMFIATSLYGLAVPFFPLNSMSKGNSIRKKVRCCIIFEVKKKFLNQVENLGMLNQLVLLCKFFLAY